MASLLVRQDRTPKQSQLLVELKRKAIAVAADQALNGQLDVRNRRKSKVTGHAIEP
jgi:hypothetical protein